MGFIDAVTGVNTRLYLLQIFEKALDEPKYCSMYAQLCRRLSEEAPNFDPPDGPCTFNRLLLNKCQVSDVLRLIILYEKHA